MNSLNSRDTVRAVPGICRLTDEETDARAGKPLAQGHTARKRQHRAWGLDFPALPNCPANPSDALTEGVGAGELPPDPDL